MEGIKELVKEMLRHRVVEGVFAPVWGLSKKDIFPAFITKEEEAEKIFLDTYYPFSLAGILAKLWSKRSRVGLMAHTCDIRALVELAKREQVALEQVYSIGLECQEDRFPFPCCHRCEHLVPFMADVAFYLDGTASFNTEKGRELASFITVPISEKRQTPREVRERARKRQEEDFAPVWELRPDQRLKYWLSYFDRCIKCYGCRNSCPLCFCKDCCLEPHKEMVKPGGNPPDKLFHFIRLMHVADSCVNCGRCEAACPMNIPISRIYHMLNRELFLVFHYEPGLQPEVLPPLWVITEEEMKRSGVEIA